MPGSTPGGSSVPESSIRLLLAVDLAVEVGDVDPVAELARSMGAIVEVLHVVAPEPDFFGYEQRESPTADALRTREFDEATIVVEAVTDAIAAHGVSTESTIVAGPTIETILDRADEIDAKLIAIVGRHHHLGHRLLLGSAGQALLKSSHLPVLVSPAQKSKAAGSGKLAAVDQLIHLIDRAAVDGELTDLRSAAEAHLDDPASPDNRQSLGDRLRDPISHFESDHVSLTRAINDVAYYLSGMGI